MKATANTTIRLGLINLPVGICKATGELDDVKFNLADSKGLPVTQQYVDGKGKVVEAGEMTRTYSGHLIDSEVLKAIADRTKLPDLSILKIEDRAYFERERHRATGYYYVQSQAKGGNPSALKLFVDALKATNSVAVTKFTFRSRQQLVVLWPDDNGLLCASTMVFKADVRVADDQVRAHLAGQYTEAEMDMAQQLFKALSNDDSDPLSEATDEAIPERKALVEKAMNGEKIEAPEAPQKAANTALADALAQMLAAQEKVAV